jgi:hypothetical protein
MHIPLVDCKPLYWLLWPSVQLSVRTSNTMVFYLWWLLGYLFHKNALMMTTTPLFSSLIHIMGKVFHTDLSLFVLE